MKIRIFCALMAIVSSYSYGQVGRQLDNKDLDRLKGTTLFVLVDDTNSDYSKTLYASFAKFWTFTKFKMLRISELKNKINDENASFFAFNCSYQSMRIGGGAQYGGGAPADHGQQYESNTPINGNSRDYENLLIDSNARVYTPGEETYDIRTGTFSYGIFLGNKKTTYEIHSKLSPYMLVRGTHLVDAINLDIVSNQQGDSASLIKLNPNFKFFVDQPLIESEKKTISEIPFYVLLLQKHLEHFWNDGKEPKTKKLKNKINFSVSVKSTTDNETAKTTIYDNGDDIIYSSTLLVDSNLCDNLGKKILAKALGMDESKIKLVSWDDILRAIQNKEENTTLIYAHDMGRNSLEQTLIWSTNGTCLAKMENFVVSYHLMSKNLWEFGIPKRLVYGIERSDVQILN